MDSTAGSHFCSFCPHFNAQRARVTRASGVFRFLPSPQGRKKLCISDLWVKDSPLFPSQVKAKRAQSFTHKTHCINGLRVKMKAGIANSLSARCAGACTSARKEVRRRKRRMVGWRRSVRRFPQKWGGRREKKGRFERKSTIFHSISPDSQEIKYFSHKIFGHSKLNSYFCA